MGTEPRCSQSCSRVQGKQQSCSRSCSRVQGTQRSCSRSCPDFREHSGLVPDLVPDFREHSSLVPIVVPVFWEQDLAVPMLVPVLVPDFGEHGGVVPVLVPVWRQRTPPFFPNRPLAEGGERHVEPLRHAAKRLACSLIMRADTCAFRQTTPRRSGEKTSPSNQGAPEEPRCFGAFHERALWPRLRTRR